MTAATTEELRQLRAAVEPTLAPCPHCDGWGLGAGHEMAIHFDPKLVEARGRWQIQCYACGATQRAQDTPQEAARCWNERRRPRPSLGGA
jgi:hypothetical protein